MLLQDSWTNCNFHFEADSIVVLVEVEIAAVLGGGYCSID